MIATPIGNLEDLSRRAGRLLGEVALIACEDTRQTGKLLDHLGLSRPMVSLHEHNEQERVDSLLDTLQSGSPIALVSDAGTPTLSDPGFRLVQEAARRGVPVVPIPGPCAAVAALSASGLPTDAFYFGGFLHHKRSRRVGQLTVAAHLEATLIFYESPHRILEALSDVADVLGDRPVVLAREITKIHEEFLRGSAAQLLQELRGRDLIRGEFTILIGKSETKPIDDRPVAEAVEELVRAGVSRMDAMKEVARSRGLSKRDVYRLLQSGS